MYHVYILFSSTKNRYYTGFTGDDLSERIRRHNSQHKGFTGGVIDWELKYTENYSTKNEAIKREHEIKAWKNRKFIE